MEHEHDLTMSLSCKAREVARRIAQSPPVWGVPIVIGIEGQKPRTRFFKYDKTCHMFFC